MNSDIKNRMDERDKWYGNAVDYWKTVSSDLEGMLGGYQQISPVDVEGSKKFLKDLKKRNFWKSGSGRALDCGAGIGRVTKHLLLPIFDCVDLVEQNDEFLIKAKIYLGDHSDKIGEFYSQGLQDFCPREKHYDIIWFQWVVGHLTEDDFIRCLQRFKAGLKPGGCICIKDNVAGNEAVFDESDSSVTRTNEQYLNIFKASGLKVLFKVRQSNIPKELYKVNMYALS